MILNHFAGESGAIMNMAASFLGAVDFIMRELALFAAAGFILLGASDLCVDLLYLWVRAKRRVIRPSHHPGAATARPAAQQGPLAIFIPAWDESAVIGPMLGNTLRTFGERDYVIYVGCYPNDPATIAAVSDLASDKVRLVVGPSAGPTSKADCLNSLWSRMRANEAAGGFRFKAVVLHDAEDVVHPDELGLFDALIERFDLVQLPVVPLIDERSRWIAGHYLDEFAEAHGKEMVVREALGASIPSAGVGCAISRRALEGLASMYDSPFDPGSLTEDYELGLRLRGAGFPATFVRLRAGAAGPIVATREYFPATLAGAVAQKARWMTGIALAGWDRLGWGGALAERWMRLRDRQSVFAALVLFAGYCALVLWSLALVAGQAVGRSPAPLSGALTLLLAVNSVLLLWRLAMRFAFVTALHGWREGLRSLPRVVTGNIVAMMAARRAVVCYLVMLRTGRAAVWDKTAHVFPSNIPAE
jgi:adsorption protein B